MVVSNHFGYGSLLKTDSVSKLQATSNMSVVGKEGYGLGKRMKVLRVRLGRVKMEGVKLALFPACFFCLY